MIVYEATRGQFTEDVHSNSACDDDNAGSHDVTQWAQSVARTAVFAR